MRLLPILPTLILLPALAASAAEPVAVPAFREVQLRGGGEVSVRPGPVQRVTIVEGSSQFTTIRVERRGELRISACNNRCPRNYRLRVDIQSPNVPDLAVDGGGAIRVAPGFRGGSRLAVAVNGGGSIDSRSVDASWVAAAVNGGGSIKLRARSSLQAAVNGGGSIRYLGSPTVQMAVRGGGMVSPGN